MSTAMKRRRTGVVDSIRHRWVQVACGALLGATWAAALRAYMVELAGSTSSFSWWGTFGAIIAPGAIAGGLLALAWRHARAGRASAWWALAPAPLAVALLLEPGALEALATSGLGGGAIGVVATGLIGGAAAGQRGPVWLRAVLAALWVALLAGLAATVVVVAQLPLTSPRGLWLTVLVVGLIVLLTLACAAPFLQRRGVDPR